MAIEKEYSKDGAPKEVIKLATETEKSTGAGFRSGEKYIDKEYFLRETFRQDPWQGCTLVFKHYYAPLCSHAIRFVYSRTYAEDIVSEVFLEFWQKGHYKKIHTTYRTYLFQAVRNRSMNFIRKEFGRDVQPVGENDLLEKSPTPEQVMMYDEFYHKIQDGIEQLPPKCKKVFLMSRYEGKALKEIADLQDISVRTVETHISKALRMMREVLDQADQ